MSIDRKDKQDVMDALSAAQEAQEKARAATKQAELAACSAADVTHRLEQIIIREGVRQLKVEEVEEHGEESYYSLLADNDRLRLRVQEAREEARKTLDDPQAAGGDYHNALATLVDTLTEEPAMEDPDV